MEILPFINCVSLETKAAKSELKSSSPTPAKILAYMPHQMWYVSFLFLGLFLISSLESACRGRQIDTS